MVQALGEGLPVVIRVTVRRVLLDGIALSVSDQRVLGEQLKTELTRLLAIAHAGRLSHLDGFFAERLAPQTDRDVPILRGNRALHPKALGGLIGGEVANALTTNSRTAAPRRQ
jgi:hypothetical protein